MMIPREAGIISHQFKDYHDARALVSQLEAFLRDHYGIDLNEAHEDPHVLAFLDYCVERPCVRHGGVLIQGPLRLKLPIRIRKLKELSTDLAFPIRLTELSQKHAQRLAIKYANPRPGARSFTPAQFTSLVEAIDSSSLEGKQLKAIVLCLREMWGRPSELLERIYPDEVIADYDEGIVIVAPRSKTNDGPDPEYFAISHDEDRTMCAVCALRESIDCFDSSYTGWLFPIVDHGVITNRRLTTMTLRRRLKAITKHCSLDGLGLKPYSLRKYSATLAAASGAPWEHMMRGLRHVSLRNTLRYVDFDVIFDRMEALLG